MLWNDWEFQCSYSKKTSVQVQRNITASSIGAKECLDTLVCLLKMAVLMFTMLYLKCVCLDEILDCSLYSGFCLAY